MLIEGKLMNQTWKNSKKLSFGPNVGAFVPNLGRQFFFTKIRLRQSLDIMVRYHHVKYQKKIMIRSWGNLVTDGRTDGRTDGQTDESGFIGQCPTNVKRPIKYLCFVLFMFYFAWLKCNFLFVDAVDCIAFLLTKVYYKNIFSLKSEKEKRILMLREN